MTLVLIGLILIAAAIALLRIHELPPFAPSVMGAPRSDMHQPSIPGSCSPLTDAPPVEYPTQAKEPPRTKLRDPDPVSRPISTTEAAVSAEAAIPQAPPYPPDEVMAMPEGLPQGWLSLKGTAKGHQKEVLQDAFALHVSGGSVIMVVADGAGSKPCSKAGADHAVAHVIGKLPSIVETLVPEHWPEEAEALFLDAAKSLADLASSEGKPVQDYSCTLIVLVATDSHVLCAHVGDGRAGYLGEDGILRAAMTPYKGQEANSTVFLGMLDASNSRDYLRAHVIPGRARAVMALSDGPENVCWHTATLDPEGVRLVDPNKPAASFFGKIVVQLAGASAANVPAEDLDAKWSQFLESGNSMLAEERDDKTLLFAMRG